MLTYFNPLSWLRWFGEFAYSWLLSIPWRDAPKAIPAIILVVVLFAASMVAWTEGGWRNRLLNKQLNVALEQEDYETAELVLRRQLSASPTDSQIQYNLAKTMDLQLRTDDAISVMRQLAIHKQHAGAARWLLTKEYLDMKWGALSEEQRDEFGYLLQLINKKVPNDLGIKNLYADYLVAAEKFPQALPVLDALSAQNPMRGLQAAAISRRLGNFPTANQYANKTLAAVSKLAQEDPSNVVLALAVAQNQLFLERYQGAVETLQRSIDKVKKIEDLERLHQAIGDAIVAWVGHIKESSTDTASERIRIMKMLDYALKKAPSNPRVLTLVADQVLATLTDDNEEVARRRNALVTGAAPGINHFIKGTSALMQNDTKTAVMHLTLAADFLPRSGAILNNLAVAIATRPEANLDQALKMANQAIEMTPKATPHFYETRGQIQFMRKEYMKAIPDLTRALKLKSLAPKAHETLAKCYKELGQQELSDEHARAAKMIAEDLRRIK